MNDPICYELRIISIASGTSVKCYSPKSFPSFKVSMEISFNRIMCDHILQRLFETCVQTAHATSSLACLLARYATYWARIKFGWSAFRSWSASCSFKRRTLAMHTSNRELSSQPGIQKQFHFMPCHTAALIAARGGCTKYWFRTVHFYFLLHKSKKVLVSSKFLISGFWWIYMFWDVLITIWVLLENVYLPAKMCVCIWQKFCVAQELMNRISWNSIFSITLT